MCPALEFFFLANSSAAVDMIMADDQTRGHRKWRRSIWIGGEALAEWLNDCILKS